MNSNTVHNPHYSNDRLYLSSVCQNAEFIIIIIIIIIISNCVRVRFGGT